MSIFIIVILIYTAAIITGFINAPLLTFILMMVAYFICMFINALRDRSFFERRAINKRIKKFYKKNKPRVILDNANLKLKLIVDDNSVKFYCINKKSPKGSFERFIIKSKPHNVNKEDILMTWSFFDMQFNYNTTMQDLIDFHSQLRLGGGVTIRKNVGPIKRTKYELYFIFDDKPYICCKKVFISKRKKKRNKTRYKNEYFIVRSDLETLYDIYFSVATKYTKINSYEKILQLLSERKDCSIEQLEYEAEEKPKIELSQKDNLVDINSATESEFAKLPGVNVILAKRIVIQRETINGFKNKEEFYDFCKLKPHFTEQLNNLITVGEFDIIEFIFREDELMVDLINDYDEEDDDDIYDDDNDIIVDL